MLVVPVKNFLGSKFKGADGMGLVEVAVSLRVCDKRVECISFHVILSQEAQVNIAEQLVEAS